MIQPFDEQPSKFRTWMKAVDNYAVVIGANDPRKVIMAYPTSSVAVK